MYERPRSAYLKFIRCLRAGVAYLITVFFLANGSVWAQQLKPDLVPLADVGNNWVYGWYLDQSTDPNKVLLRLSTTVANLGDGPLEMWGGNTIGSQQEVFQRIYDSNGGYSDSLAGFFVYHATHGHIHFEGFAYYFLREVTAGGGVGDTVAGGEKVSFCLLNVTQVDANLTNSTLAHGRGGNSCGSIQGISVGYADVYGASLPDQWIDVTNVPSGTYWLEVVADPENRVEEVDDTNNIVRIQIQYTRPPNLPPINDPPIAVMNSQISSGNAPLSVNFDALGSSDPDGSLTGFDWDFGDGNSASGITTTHTYIFPGTYTASLLVTDNTGLTSTATQTIVVNTCNAPVSLNLTLDNYPEETSWVLADSNGLNIASGGTYGYLADGSVVALDFCLLPGCYDFTINDSYGDGICCGYGNGSYTLTDSEGNTLVSGGAFGSSETSTFCITQNIVQTSSQVSQSSDDAEENIATGYVSLTSSDLELTEDGTTVQLVGVRFQGLNIPPGATIQNSWLQFTTDETGAGLPGLIISGEAADNASAFTNIGGNISSRALTTSNISWSPSDWNTIGEAGSPQQTSDISQIIQEIVNRPGWNSLSALALIISGTGDRTAESFDGSPSGAPILYVEYAVSGNIAPIASAIANPETGFSPLLVNFDGSGSVDPDGNIVSYSWDFGDGNTGTGATPSYTYHNAGTYTAILTVTDDNGDSDNTPINITVNPANVSITSSSQVSASDDDAEENLLNGSVSLTSSDLELAEDGSKVQLVGMRFTGLDIPSGALIQNAWIQFTNDEIRTGASALTIKGEAADNAVPFSNSAGNISSRPKTTSEVGWSIPDWITVGEAGTDQQTPDISTVIQEIVSRPGWTTSSALVLTIQGSGRRAAESFNGSSSAAPVLFVEYSAGGGNVYPVASFSATPVAGPASLNVTFDGTGSSDPDGSIISYDWDFGDGNLGSGVSSSHTYNTAGNYTASLTVTDNEGAVNATSQMITVYPSGLVQTSAQPGGASDDAEEEVATGAISLNSSDLELGTEGGVPQVVGIRFAGLNIPSGVSIQNAWIQFTTDEADGGQTHLSIRGELSSDALPFSGSNGDISSRPTTSASISWSPLPWNSVGASSNDQQTPDLSAVIQEIVNQAGWSSTSALAVVIEGTGERTAESYNGAPVDAPVLYVEYNQGNNSQGARLRSIGMNPEEIEVKLYPNPFSEHFFVEIISPEGEEMEVQMVDLRGRIIFHQEHASARGRIRIDRPVPAGVYFIRVMNGSVRKDFKVLKT